ncbi:hypothetical protein [Sphingopyxis sp. JAI128]|uniref:hypothetical protein n=1 Tax=Sphingopyxis sp. JAI128 TaxID=2723066 RepID=UPI001610BA41|nr:hypothetical protein [Sphingopyxis sp. JAI128]MBB6427906.1 hypothetical protein [Sphingopyxis sp. JAI128]
MIIAKDTMDIVAIELPSGTRAVLEGVAAENFTTPEALMSRYVLDGIEQTILGRRFDMALRGEAGCQKY